MLGEILRDEVVTPDVKASILIAHGSKGGQIAPGDDGDVQRWYGAQDISHEDKRRQEDDDNFEV